MGKKSGEKAVIMRKGKVIAEVPIQSTIGGSTSSKPEFDLEWNCLCGKKNVTTLDHLRRVKASHTGIRCPACKEKMMVSIRIAVEGYSEWMSKHPKP